MEKLPIMEADDLGFEHHVGDNFYLQIAAHECNYDGIDFIVLRAQAENGQWYELAKIRLEDLAESRAYRFPFLIKLSLEGQRFFGSAVSTRKPHSPSPEQV